MTNSYTVKLVARNEGIEYCDEGGVYRFNVTLADKTWIVYLPCSKGDFYEAHEFTEDEQKKIIPRIVEYLENRKFLGMFGSTYPVKFEREKSISAQVAKSRRDASRYWSDLQKK